MNVYVAGKTQALHDVRIMQALVRNAGHHITHDWTAIVEANGGDVTEVEITVEKKQQYAMDDMFGVASADIIIALGHPRLSGTLWEVGGGAILMKTIWLVNWEQYGRVSVFDDLPNVEKLTVQEVGERLWKLSVMRAERQPGQIVIQQGGTTLFATCEVCGEPAYHRASLGSPWKLFCCRHYLEQGGAPADWHPDCMFYAGRVGA